MIAQLANQRLLVNGARCRELLDTMPLFRKPGLVCRIARDLRVLCGHSRHSSWRPVRSSSPTFAAGTKPVKGAPSVLELSLALPVPRPMGRPAPATRTPGDRKPCLAARTSSARRESIEVKTTAVGSADPLLADVRRFAAGWARHVHP